MMETTKLAKTLECFVTKMLESSCLIFELSIKIAKKLHKDCVNVQDWELDNNLMVLGGSPNQYVTFSSKTHVQSASCCSPTNLSQMTPSYNTAKIKLVHKTYNKTYCLMLNAKGREEWGYSNQPRPSCHQKKLYAAILLQKCQEDTWDCGKVSCMSPFEPFHHSCPPHAAIVPPAAQPYKLNQMTSLLCA